MHVIKNPGASILNPRTPGSPASHKNRIFRLKSVPTRITSSAPNSDSSHAQLWLVNILTQAFVANKRYCSIDAQRVLSSDDLPLELERVAMRIDRSKQVWLAWTNGRQTWFVVAQLARDAASTYQDTAIRIFFYDLDGVLLASGVWVLHSNGTWALDSIDNTL